MVVERQVSQGERLITLTVSGPLGDAELASLVDHVEGDDVQSDFALLVDMRQADGRGITAHGVRSLALMPLRLAGNSRRAVVVPTGLGYGMARMYEMLRDDHGSVRVFRDAVAAKHWVLSGDRID